jgi:hypothetical protein
LEEEETLLLDDVQLLRDKVAFENEVPLGVGLGIEAFKCKLHVLTMLAVRRLIASFPNHHQFKETVKKNQKTLVRRMQLLLKCT